MTFSSLISGTIPHHDKYNRRPVKVTRVIQHHWADITMGGEESLASPRRRASVNYLIHNDGKILGQVPEEFRPWTSSSSLADNPSITIEVQNETAGPEWRVSSAAQHSIAMLIADIARRKGFGSLNRTNYRGHREFASTACPGPYLYPRLQLICDMANNLVPVVDPVVPTNEDEEMKPWFIRARSGAIVGFGPDGCHAMTAEAWGVWTNLGFKVSIDNMDNKPFSVIIESFGGLK